MTYFTAKEVIKHYGENLRFTKRGIELADELKKKYGDFYFKEIGEDRYKKVYLTERVGHDIKSS